MKKRKRWLLIPLIISVGIFIYFYTKIDKILPVCEDYYDVPILLEVTPHSIVIDADGGTTLPLYQTFSMMNGKDGTKYTFVGTRSGYVLVKMFIKNGSTYNLHPNGYTCLQTINISEESAPSVPENRLLLQKNFPEQWKIIKFINVKNLYKTDLETEHLLSEDHKLLILNHLPHDFNYNSSITLYTYDADTEVKKIFSEHIDDLLANQALKVTEYPIESHVENSYAFCRYSFNYYCTYYGINDERFVIFQLSLPRGFSANGDRLKSDFASLIHPVEYNLLDAAETSIEAE